MRESSRQFGAAARLFASAEAHPAGLPAVLIVEFARKHTAGKPAG
ncbi:MAG TPA: hypothetical protein VMY42_06380 [Thermoguttaceae bacterium]|nr:hypothetical protein [Thermoguttaceae bacterium]